MKSLYFHTRLNRIFRVYFYPILYQFKDFDNFFDRNLINSSTFDVMRILHFKFRPKKVSAFAFRLSLYRLMSNEQEFRKKVERGVFFCPHDRLVNNHRSGELYYFEACCFIITRTTGCCFLRCNTAAW